MIVKFIIFLDNTLIIFITIIFIIIFIIIIFIIIFIIIIFIINSRPSFLS